MKTTAKKSVFRRIVTCVVAAAMAATMMSFAAIGSQAEESAMSVWDGTSYTALNDFFRKGQASSKDDFKGCTIDCAADFIALQMFNSDEESTNSWKNCTFTLTCDIDLGEQDWTGISNNSEVPFKGDFDFNGHKIVGLPATALDTAAVQAATKTVTGQDLINAMNNLLGAGYPCSGDSDYDDDVAWWENVEGEKIYGFGAYAGIGNAFKVKDSYRGFSVSDGQIVVGDLDPDHAGGKGLKGISLVEFVNGKLAGTLEGQDPVVYGQAFEHATSVTGEYMAQKLGEWMHKFRTGDPSLLASYSPSAARESKVNLEWRLLVNYPGIWEAKTLEEANAAAAAPCKDTMIRLKTALFGYNESEITNPVIEIGSPEKPTEATTDASKTSGGCGSAIISTASVVMLACGAAIVLKKKKSA